MKTFTTTHKVNRKGFTVLELLLVLGAIVLVVVVGLLKFDFKEYLREKRDDQRIADMQDLKRAIDAYIDVGTGTVSLGSANTVFSSNYGSVRDKNGGLVTLKPTTVNSLITNSLGWVPINFDADANKTRISSLPKDPINEDSFIYTFTNDGEGKYKITARLESKKYASLQRQDCGQNNDRYEVGTNCDLFP